jgi:hypothetical protein
MSVRPLECLDAGSNLHAILLRANYLVVYCQDDLAWYVGVRQIALGKVSVVLGSRRFRKVACSVVRLQNDKRFSTRYK